MFMVRRTPAALFASWLAAVALLFAGCSHVAPTTDIETEPSETEGEYVAADEDALEADEDLKLDEADIGTSGPDQIEDAIETLDAQTEGQPALVSEFHVADGTAPAGGDVFERMRSGFTLTDVEHETVERELSWFVRHPAYLDRTFKRGERYLYHIVQEIEARGMPLELALLPVVESAFNPVAYSRARASGLWQFIPATGRRYGLKQNWYYDGRRDVVAATSAALDYLQFLHREFDGDWLLAVAAYNCGEAAVGRSIKRNIAAGKPTDFFSLKLPKETRAYVPKLLAMRRIVADPSAHGLIFAPIANQPYFAKVDTAGQLDLHVAADLAELPKEELLALNPAFNHWVTDPDGPHHLLVPVDRQERLSAGIAALPPEQRVRIVYHRVRPGDTLGGIADKYNISVAALRSTNKLRGSVIHPGQDLLVAAAPRGNDPQFVAERVAVEAEPARMTASSKGRHRVRRGDTLWSIARTHGVSLDRLASANGLKRNGTLSVGQTLKIPGTATLASTNPSAVSPGPVTYIVRSGDTVSRIANKFRVSITDVLGWNDLDTRNVIKPGQRLVMYVDNRRSGI
jgi:membrane-bound lytic murein transglycosylase D